MSTFQYNQIAIEDVAAAVAAWVDQETVSDYFYSICNEYDRESAKNPHPRNWENSKMRRLLQVNERLKLTQHLSKEIGEDFFKKYTYPPLITYLTLTCFDQLGQPANWTLFNQWIESPKKTTEREAIIRTITVGDKLQFSKALYEAYQKMYGVKNSFYNFLRNVMPAMRGNRSSVR